MSHFATQTHPSPGQPKKAPQQKYKLSADPPACVRFLSFIWGESPLTRGWGGGGRPLRPPIRVAFTAFCLFCFFCFCNSKEVLHTRRPKRFRCANCDTSKCCSTASSSVALRTPTLGPSQPATRSLHQNENTLNRIRPGRPGPEPLEGPTRAIQRPFKASGGVAWERNGPKSTVLPARRESTRYRY